jgi:hypothetical protein
MFNASIFDVSMFSHPGRTLNFAPPAGGRAAKDPSLRFGMTFQWRRIKRRGRRHPEERRDEGPLRLPRRSLFSLIWHHPERSEGSACNLYY